MYNPYNIVVVTLDNVHTINHKTSFDPMWNILLEKMNKGLINSIKESLFILPIPFSILILSKLTVEQIINNKEHLAFSLKYGLRNFENFKQLITTKWGKKTLGSIMYKYPNCFTSKFKILRFKKKRPRKCCFCYRNTTINWLIKKEKIQYTLCNQHDIYSYLNILDPQTKQMRFSKTLDMDFDLIKVSMTSEEFFDDRPMNVKMNNYFTTPILSKFVSLKL